MNIIKVWILAARPKTLFAMLAPIIIGLSLSYKISGMIDWNISWMIILSGILIDKFLLFSKNFKKHIQIVTKVGGTILLLTGIAILTGQLQILGFFILEYFPSLGKIG